MIDHHQGEGTAASVQAGPPVVSVVVPTLNESGNIEKVIEQVLGAFERAGIAVEVLVADGGSTDGTREQVARYTADRPVRLVEATSGRGLAGDVLEAAAAARGEVVVVMDGDLSHDPCVAPELAGPVLAGDCDMVVGSRHVPGGSNPQWPWTRRFISRVAGLLAWPLVDVRDPMSGFFAVRRQALLAVDAGRVEGFKIGLEVMVQNERPLRVAEHPITFHDRCQGRSKMSGGQVMAYLRRMTALAGGSAGLGSAWRFAAVGLAGLVVDMATFWGLYHGLGGGLAVSHILSFTLATVVNYVFNSRWSFRAVTGQRLEWRGYVRFLTVCLMALFVRGGVLAMLTDKVGWPAEAALGLAIVAAAVINYLGCAFFVFADFQNTTLQTRWRVAAVGLAGYAVLLRLVYLGLADLIPEEAYYWNYAKHPALSYLDHPPMVAWLIRLGTWLVGDTELGVRLGTFACWFVTAGFCYHLTRRMFDKATAMRAVLLVAVLPFFFLFGFFATPDAPLTACWAAALFFAERALLGRRRWAWAGLGMALGLGMLSKYTIALLGPAVLVFVLADRDSRRWLVRPQPYLAVLLALVLFLPVLLWNHEHGYVSFTFQGARRWSETGQFGLPMLLVDMMLLLTPTGLIGAVWAMGSRQSWFERWAGGDPAVRRQRLFTVVFTVVPLSVFVWFSLTHQTKPNWTGPVWLAVIPALSRQVGLSAVAVRSRLDRMGQAAWGPTLAVVMLLFGGLMHYLAIGLPGLDYATPMRLPVAWEEFGRDVERLEDDLEQHLRPAELYVVGMDKYFTASELAFYRHDEADDREGVAETTSRHLFGQSDLMYAMWMPPHRLAGQTLLLISFKPEELATGRLERWIERAEPIGRRQIIKHGRGVGSYYYRVVYGYHPSGRAVDSTVSTGPAKGTRGRLSGRAIARHTPIVY